MKIKYFFFILAALIVFANPADAITGRLATESDISLLKKDLLQGRVMIGKARLMKVIHAYGKAANITDSRQRVVYDYGGLKLTFEKVKYLKDWEYDYSKAAVYSDGVDDLRFDLEDGQIIGDFVRYSDILSSYGDPTEAHEKDDDGALSTYYYGTIKLIFETNITLQSWKGSGLNETASAGVISDGVLGTSSGK